MNIRRIEIEYSGFFQCIFPSVCFETYLADFDLFSVTFSDNQALLERTGYTLDVTTGQRKYGGPPPESAHSGAQPTIGTEVQNLSPL